MKRHATAILIDTHHLTDGSLQLVGYRPFDGFSADDCHEAAQRALTSARSHFAIQLRDSLNLSNDPQKHAPIQHHDAKIIRSAWHHGEQYMSHCIGPIEELIKQCDLTENERESLMITESKIGGEGRLALGVARGTTKSIPTTMSSFAASLQFVGMIILSPILFPDAISSVEKLNEKGTPIIYISRDPASYVRAVAVAAHVPIDVIYKGSRKYSPHMRLIADTPHKEYESIAQHFAAGAYRVKHDLHEAIR